MFNYTIYMQKCDSFDEKRFINTYTKIPLGQKRSMIKKKPLKKERCKIIVSSNTDARKKPFVLSITRRTLIVMLCVLPLFVFGAVGAAAVACTGQWRSGSEAYALEEKLKTQLMLFEIYSAELGSLRLAYCDGSAGSGQVYSPEQEGAAFSAITDAGTCVAQEFERKQGVYHESALSVFLSSNANEAAATTPGAIALIPMTDAIAMINADFQTNIVAQIEAAKANEQYDEFEVIYDGDTDGDSYVVSNWADVLSVYAAKTMYDGQKFLTITPENIGLLSDTYNDMNEISINTKKELTAPDENSGAAKTVLKIYVSVDSLTYCEEAQRSDFDGKQVKLLDNLMSPNYYTYFADLLGINVYDGMRSEELEEIIRQLPPGTKAEAIVKAAMIRLGHPYSRGRRGSGNYVDCSYFTWWVYNQVGVSIPTSSVEQAKYCFNNGYTVKIDELKPGDLVFWRKTTCNCGRWKEIHHAGIYIGCGKVIDASSSKGRVIMRELWSGGERRY